MKIRRVFNSFIPKLFGNDGQTFYPFIFFRMSRQELKKMTGGRNLYKHEMIHIEQCERYGPIKFAFMYMWELIRKGYRNNKYEIEAYARQHENFEGEEMGMWMEDME